MGLLPDSILEGVGDSLLTAAYRYAYIVTEMFHPPKMPQWQRNGFSTGTR